MANLKIKNLQKGFEGFSIIKGIDLEVNDKEFVVFVGPSGCGKSTLLRLIAGLEEVSEGTIELDGRDITEVTPAKRDLAMVFQTYALFPHMSVIDNCILAPMSVRGLSRKKAIELAQHFLTKVGIASQADKYPSQLSGGQQQRVAIARALMSEPVLLMLDEPSLGLAPKIVGELFGIIKQLREENMTVLLVEQNATAALAIADRAYVLENGRIILSGAAPVCCARPIA